MISPFSRPTNRRLRSGSIVYPFGNPARAKIIKKFKRGDDTIYRVKFIDDNIATIHWWMRIMIFPKGDRLDLERDQISDNPQR